MKSLLFSVFVITGITNCTAQFWKPYVANAKCIYGYTQNAGTTRLINIRYDSVYTQGTTEVAYAYTKSYSNDSCLNAAHKEFRFRQFTPYPEERVYPLPIEIKQTPDSIISSTFILLPNTHKGLQPNGDVYEKDSIMDILGIVDSVKIYTLEDFGRVILSKHFGLVNLGGYVLKGFETDSVTLGLGMPHITTSLKLAPGDILYFRTIRDTSTNVFNYPPRLYTDTRDSITSVTKSMNKFNITFIRQEQNYFNPALSYSNKTIEYEIIIDEFDRMFQDGAPVQRFFENLFYTKAGVIMQIEGNDTLFSVQLFAKGSVGDCQFLHMYDLCESTTLSSNIVSLGHSSCSPIGGGGTDTKLIGSRIGNKVSGHINLSVQNSYAAIADINIYPNPASDVLYLSTNEKMDYTIVDMLGNQQLTGQAYGTIPVQSLATGLYMLRLQSNGGYKTLLIHKN